MSKLIYIYKDKGCTGTDKLKKMIRRVLPNSKVKFIGAEDIRDGILSNNPPDAFIMGGGQAKHYNTKLGKIGRDEIIKYTNRKDSLSYFFCAALYYLSKELKYSGFKKGVIETINNGIEQDQLGLFEGTASGCFETEQERATKKVIYGDGNTANLFYFKGPSLTNLTEDDEVLAHFKDPKGHLDKLPAVIRCGKNKNIFGFAVHPEYDSAFLSKAGLKSDQNEIDSFIRYMLSDLLTPKHHLGINKKVKFRYDEKMTA